MACCTALLHQHPCSRVRYISMKPSGLLLHASCTGVRQQGTSLGQPWEHRNLAFAQPVGLHDTSTVLAVLLHAYGSNMGAGSDDSISLALKRPPALLARAPPAFPLLSHADLGVQPIHLSLPDPLEIMPLSSGLVAEALEGLQAAFIPQASCWCPAIVMCLNPHGGAVWCPQPTKLNCAHVITLAVRQARRW